jgi:hypothetical protein
LLFRQPTEDLTTFTHGFDLDEGDAVAGVHLADGQAGPEDPSIAQDLLSLVAFVL